MPYLENETDAREAARVLNDSYAELAQRMPRRFNSYVSLPLPHVEASLREIERGLDELDMAGITIGCSILNRSVTDKQFEPLYAEMNRRAAVLFFHPMVNGICSQMITDFGLEGAAGTTIEDTVVVLQMIVRRIPNRYPNIRMIVPHLGGLIPMLLNRMDNQVVATNPDLPEKPSATARRFWYDTGARIESLKGVRRALVKHHTAGHQIVKRIHHAVDQTPDHLTRIDRASYRGHRIKAARHPVMR
jgi:predicted TIM-barrel fold metal-dependent hydrolase